MDDQKGARTCPKCAYTTPWGFALDYHVGKAHPAGKPIVFRCGASKPEPHDCTRCRHSFYTKPELASHTCTTSNGHNHDSSTANHHNDSPHPPTAPFACPVKCATCVDFRTHSLFIHSTHARLKHAVRRRCAKCAYSTRHPSRLQSHRIRAHSIASFVCSRCRSSAAARAALSCRCSRKSAILRRFKCDHCAYTSRYANALVKHSLHKHPNRECWKCAFVGEDPKELTRHTGAVHGLFASKCEHCSYRARTADVLRRHLNEFHTYQCAQCPYETTSEEFLTRHVQFAHKYLHWFSCKKCPYKAEVTSHLMEHMLRAHSGVENKQIGCDRCAFKCIRLADLRRHILMEHAGPSSAIFKIGTTNNIGPHHHHQAVHHHRQKEMLRCTRCPFTAPKRAVLRRHIAAYHDAQEEVVWYKCDLCPHQTKRKYDLKRHVARRHNQIY